MKNLIYFLALGLTFFLFSCSDEENNIVSNNQSDAAQHGAGTTTGDKFPSSTDDLICPDANINNFYTNSYSPANSVTLERSTVPYEDYYSYYVTELHSNADSPAEVWIYIDGVSKTHDFVTPPYSEMSHLGYYSLGYGTHTFKIVVKNHGLLHSVSEISATRTLTIHDPLIPYAPTLSEGTHARCPSMTWTAMTNATSYKVYRDAPTGLRTLIQTTTETSFIDTQKRLYRAGDFLGSERAIYSVKAVGPHGESPFSNTVGFLVVQ